MFVTHLSGPSGVNFEDAQLQLPSWSDIEQAIRQLDGCQLNYLKVQRSEPNEEKDKSLTIAGGEEGLFFVYVTISRLNQLSQYFYLMDPDYTDREEGWSFLVNQSDTECYRYEMNGIDPTLKAARTFAETGELEPSLTWKQS